MEFKRKYKKYIELGKIITTHGVNGFLKIDGWCDDLSIFNELGRVYLNLSGEEFLNIVKIKFVRNYVLVKFKEIDDIGEARKYIGRIIYIKREDLRLEEGAVLIQDLIGMEVYDYYKQEINYGRIKEVIKTAANDVYVISDEDKKEILIPVIDSVVKKKDMDGNKIYIRMMEGLLDV